jgi:asparagine synthase (glutamine-hydrolysing)
VCGIAGKLWFKPIEDVDAASRLLTAMTDAISHRGPDDGAIWLDAEAGIGFGHRRLAIIDLDPRSAQPMTTPDQSLHITYNGEIYNYQEMRADLLARGHTLRTEGDTEALLHRYEDYGLSSLEAYFAVPRGMFAFGLWDAQQRKLILARDPLGKKALYYAVTEDGISFASEIEALLCDPSVPRRMRSTAIRLYLSLGYVPAPLTAFEGIYKLPAGHYLVADASGPGEPRAYWRPQFEPKLEMPEWELHEAIRDKLDEATRLRMISDVPFGAFLSGGLDSSAIVAMMSRHSPRPVKTFSVAFKGSPLDESRYARQVAEHFGCDHTELEADIRPETLPALVRSFGEPFADPAAIPTYFMSKAAREHVTVVLIGDGGDENFAGYTLRHLSYTWAERLQLAPGIRKGLHRISEALPATATEAGRPYRLRKTLRILSQPNWRRNVALMEMFAPEDPLVQALDGVVEPNSRGPYAVLEDLWRGARQYSGLDRELYFSLALHLPEHLLVKVDRASMACALEARSPMLDRDFVDFCARIPASLKLSGRTGKKIFRDAVAPLLPPEILTRKKQGFIPPLGDWLRGELRGLVQDTLLAGDSYVGQRAPEMTRRLVSEHLDGSQDHQRRLYTLLTLDLWERQLIRGQQIA